MLLIFCRGTCLRYTRSFPARSYFRLCAQLDLDHTKVTQARDIRESATRWLDSREGRTELRSLVQAVLGVPLLTVPPAPPEGITEGYNPILDSERPRDIRSCLR